jgi:hypothetical protein
MKTLNNNRMSIDIIANCDIDVDEEIIIKYGPGYCKKMDDFLTEGGKQKPLFQSNRDTKLKKNNI